MQVIKGKAAMRSAAMILENQVVLFSRICLCGIINKSLQSDRICHRRIIDNRRAVFYKRHLPVPILRIFSILSGTYPDLIRDICTDLLSPV